MARNVNKLKASILYFTPQKYLSMRNMNLIAVYCVHRYSYLADRLTAVEQSLSRETIDISSASIESYVQLQSMLKQKPLDRLTECDILNILDEQMIHPGKNEEIIYPSKIEKFIMFNFLYETPFEKGD